MARECLKAIWEGCVRNLSHDRWYQSGRLPLSLLVQRPAILTGFRGIFSPYSQIRMDVRVPITIILQTKHSAAKWQYSAWKPKMFQQSQSYYYTELGSVLLTREICYNSDQNV
jgi:hypothetical protein